MDTGAGDNNNNMVHLLNLLLEGEEEMKNLSFQLNEQQHAAAMHVQNIFRQSITVLSNMEPTGMRQMSHSHMAASVSPGRSGSGSPKSDGSERAFRKRKDVAKRIIKVPVSAPNSGPSDTALAPDDGFSWRKYGQKNILNAQYPRSYYRCTFQRTQNCQAYKHVQRSDEDPTFVVVTYIGEHTCTQQAGQTSLTQSLEHQLLIPTQSDSDKHYIIEFDKPCPAVETHESYQDDHDKILSPTFSISSVHAGLRSENPNVLSPTGSFGGPFSSGFASSGASDSNYLTAFPRDFGADFEGVTSFQGSEFEFTDGMSMPHSGTSAAYGFNVHQTSYHQFDSPYPFK